MIEIIKHPDYVRPPIVEAVIGLTVDPPWSIDDIEKSSKRLLKNYATKNDEIMIQAAVSFQHGKGVTNSDGRKNGIRLTSQDQSEILLIHLHEFLVGQLAPYPGWITFFERARRDYMDFRREAPHRKIKRLGVRFMNRMDIPLAKFPDFVPSEFCTFVPLRPPFGDEKLQS
jgi:uncharacterized protein (TIGR04255 family)